MVRLDERDYYRLLDGEQAIAAKLDLHGQTENQAWAALQDFLPRYQATGKNYILIITGKGGRDAQGQNIGVLYQQVPRWLTDGPLAMWVDGFCEAAPRHGGAGALYVRLRKKKV